MADAYWYIKNCNLFAQLSAADIADLEAESKVRKLKKGDPVYLPTEQADGVLLVAQGRVKVCHATPDGKQSILGFLDVGEIFGELSILGSSRRDEYVEATEKTTLVLLPKDAINHVLRKYPELVLGITKMIGLRRQRVEKRLRNLLFRSNRERVIHLLIELCEKYGRMADAGVTLDIRLSHQEMASIIGSTRETVTVVLGQLQKESLIQIARRRVIILSLRQLAESVNEKVPEIGGSDPELGRSQMIPRLLS